MTKLPYNPTHEPKPFEVYQDDAGIPILKARVDAAKKPAAL